MLRLCRHGPQRDDHKEHSLHCERSEHYVSSSHMNRRLKSQTSLCSEVARPCFNDGRQTIQIHYYQVFVFGDNFVLYGAITYYDYAYTASTPDAWLHKKENTSNSESKAPPTAQKLLHRHESGGTTHICVEQSCRHCHRTSHRSCPPRVCVGGCMASDKRLRAVVALH